MQYEVDNDKQFYGVLKSVKRLVSLIKAIRIDKTSQVFIHEDGVMITIDKTLAVKAYVYIKSYHFYIYNIKDEQPNFALPVDAFITCLELMVPNAVISTLNNMDSAGDYCEMTYDGTGSFLTLRRAVREHHQVTKANLIPFQPEEDSMDSSYETQGSTQKIILECSWFKDVMDNIDSNTEKVTVKLSPQDPSFQLEAEGPDLTQEFELLENSEPVIGFKCDQELTYSYLYQHFALCKKACAISEQVSIDMYHNGCIKMVFKVIGTHNTEDYISFTFIPSTNFA